MATALHARAEDQNRHWVQLNNLRVLVVEQDGQWFAQGIDLDYAASGRSFEEAQCHFEQGLAATIDQHIKRFQSIDRLLKMAPARALDELSPQQAYGLDLLTTHDLSEQLTALPFGGITYVPAHASATR